MSIYTRTRRVSITRYNTETLTYRDAIVANAGTISAGSLLAVDAFVTACKANNLWAKLIDCGVFAGDQLAAALVKLVYPNGGQALIVNHGFVAGDYTERGANGGLQGDGVAKYLSLGTTGNVANLGGIAFYMRTACGAGAQALLGGGLNDGNVIALKHIPAPTGIQLCWGGETISSGGGLAGSELITGTNNAATATTLYQAAAQLVTNAPGQGAPNLPEEFFVFASNEGGAIEFASCIGSFYALTQALAAADVANLFEAVQALQIALNRNV